MLSLKLWEGVRVRVKGDAFIVVEFDDSNCEALKGGKNKPHFSKDVLFRHSIQV